ncbi:AMP-binding protein [Streptomyces sp. NPDC047017]|uniref:AMP-binding protein n=1 Tax=Streptomyces sp. NPDC047017 TaxID=3155024 RepID=UPI0033E5DCD6
MTNATGIADKTNARGIADHTHTPAPRALGPLPDGSGVPAPVADRWRAAGLWRAGGFVHDVLRTAAAAPDRPAFTGHRAHLPAGRRSVTVSYARLALYMDRFAAALRSLGIGAGDPVALQLPNWWEAAALALACWRIGAVVVPVLPGVRAPDLERVLTAAQARVCVVPDRWEEYGNAEVLAQLAHRLPWLRRRVVIGDAAATGAVDFGTYFLRTAHERGPHGRESSLSPAGPDRPALLLNVMGMGEDHGAVLHTGNTLYAGLAAQRAEAATEDTEEAAVPPPANPVFASPLPLTSLAGLLYTVCWPLASGGTGVLQDGWDPRVFLGLVESARVDRVYATPALWAELLAAQRQERRDLSGLRYALTGGRVETPEALLDELSGEFDVRVRSAWGSPEAGLGALSYGSGKRSYGSGKRLLPGVEATVSGGRLRVRGPSVALAAWRHGEGVEGAWGTAEGWLDTGDAAVPGRPGEVTVVGRAGERTGGLFVVPVDELEVGLRAHPRVREAAVVEYTDATYGEMPCAVVVPALQEEPPGLVELRDHLARRGLTEAFLPTRLELVGSLPRDARGELRKEVLRTWLTRLRPGTPRRAPTAPEDPPHE